jgi:hypothetical protein
MVGQIRKTLQERLSITEIEYDIRRMEADLEYHKRKTKIFEEALYEQQQILTKLQKGKNEPLRGELN